MHTQIGIPIWQLHQQFALLEDRVGGVGGKVLT